ncbi:hypothetical protein [Aedoeadaptatus coxii]|uniref:hypothetical protein n=1 Tax=Aedoeadaptatus coxii TaxID=755172 RepID=UPI002AD43AA8|nr:hypothetical protein [Peptoniphilus coxii]
MCKMIKRNCLLFTLIMILVSISGCGVQDSQLTRDAKAYMETKGIISEALEEYYNMLERPRYIVAEDVRDHSETSNHVIFFKMLEDADKVADTIESEEFTDLNTLNKKSIESLRYAYLDYSLFCAGINAYSKDNSVVYDEGFQYIFGDSYKDYKAYDQLFNEYYSQVQDEEDYLNSLGVFEGLHWDSEED